MRWLKGVQQRVYDHRLATLVIATIIIALFFTAVGVVMYYSSGSAQIDLSRPDYASKNPDVTVRKQAYPDYSSTGAVDEDALQQFDDYMSNQIDDMREVDAFSGDPMALDSLQIDVPEGE